MKVHLRPKPLTLLLDDEEEGIHKLLARHVHLDPRREGVADRKIVAVFIPCGQRREARQVHKKGHSLTSPSNKNNNVNQHDIPVGSSS